MTDSQWENRIVGHDVVDPETLLANPFNFKIHTHLQKSILRAAIGAVGFIDSVTVNTVTGHVVDGHARVTVALQEGQRGVPIEYVRLTVEEEKLALLTKDAIAKLAIDDDQLLAELLADVHTDDEDLRAFLDTLGGEPAELEDMPDATEGEGDGPEHGVLVTCPKCGHKFTP